MNSNTTSKFDNVKYPVKCSWVYEHVYGGDISFSTLKREFIELLVEVWNLRPKGIHEEFLQVYVNLLLYLYKHIGLDVPIYGGKPCIHTYVERLKTWEYILNKYDRVLNVRLFKDGNNWRKPEKLIRILSHVGVFMCEEKALWLIDHLEDKGFN